MRSEGAMLGHHGTCASRTEKVYLQREWIRNKLKDHVIRESEKERERKKEREREKDRELTLALE